ncbi:MAG: pseudouridine synthase [Flavobacteriales bacterium]
MAGGPTPDKKNSKGQRGSSRREDDRERRPSKEEKKPIKRESKWAKLKEERAQQRGSFKPRKKVEVSLPKPESEKGKIRLNRFLSNAGIASRRDADQLIQLGLVKVNGKVVTEMGHKVDPRVDEVKYDDRNLKPEKLQYVLLNKPKDYITTNEDPKERRTVMHLIFGACKERIYPVGRLDRQTLGLLLFTNDGEMATRLTQNKKGVSAIFHIELSQKMRGEHLDSLREGIKLEEGFFKPEEIHLVQGDPYQIGLKMQSSKTNTIRMAFESFGYKLKKLDRVMFAGLTKKDLPRGRYRHLSSQEVNFLKMIR